MNGMHRKHTNIGIWENCLNITQQLRTIMNTAHIAGEMARMKPPLIRPLRPNTTCIFILKLNITITSKFSLVNITDTISEIIIQMRAHKHSNVLKTCTTFPIKGHEPTYPPIVYHKTKGNQITKYNLRNYMHHARMNSTG